MKVITLRIDDSLAEQLKTLAWEQRTSMNKLLTQLVSDAVQSREAWRNVGKPTGEVDTT